MSEQDALLGAITDAVPEQAAEQPEQIQAGETGAPEQVEETDEQKNARELQEREERSRARAKGIQKRFDELTRDKYAERAARERLERELDELRRGQQARQQPQEQGRPQREQFDDYAEFIRAEARWEAKEAYREAREQEMRQAQAQRAQYEAQREQQTVAETIQKSAEQYRTKVRDFDDAMEALDFEAPPALTHAIAKAENPAAILYALGKRPDVAQQIARLDPISQAKAVGAIEFALKSKTPQVSQAPAPGTPVGGKPSHPKQTLQETTDLDEWIKLRRKQINARRS